MNPFTSLGCPACDNGTTKIINTNPARSGRDIRRQRKCLKCGAGFVTYEVTGADYAMLQALRRWTQEQADEPIQHSGCTVSAADN